MRERFTCALIVSLAATSASAATYNVSNLTDLRARIGSAVAGDTIILASGIYDSTSAITLDRQGTATDRITVTAQTVGGAEVRGSAGFTFGTSAAYMDLRGFRLTHSGKVNLPAGSHHCRVTRNFIRISIATTGDYIGVAGNDHEISYNEIHNKTSGGQMINVSGPGTDIAKRVWIHHNYFHDFPPSGVNGSSAVHLGHSSKTFAQAFSIVEYNLFVQIRGENEGTICTKSSDHTIRYNTITSSSREVSLRHGNRVNAYGNFFLGGCEGLRFYGDDHKIYDNYFEGCSPSLQIGNGDGTVPDPGPLTVHDRPDRVHVTFNTFVNTRNPYMAARSGGLGAPDLVVANNIMVGGTGAALEINGPTPGAVIQGNIHWNNSAGSLGSGGRNVNPMLVEDGNSEFRLSSGSPAIDTAAGTYSYVTIDMDGQTRSGTKDVGADEFLAAGVVNRILTTADVGPNAGSQTPTPTPTPTGPPTATPTPTPTPTPTNTPTPPPAGSEITPGASAVTASTNDGNVPANAVDNSLATRWSGCGDGAWLRLDLGSVRSVGHAKIAWYNGNTRASVFDLQRSDDNTNWTNILTNVSSNGTSTLEETFDFADVDARYIRYLGHGNSLNAWNSVTEISLFSPSLPTATPTPTNTPMPTPTPTPSPTPTPTAIPTATPTPGGAPVEVTPGASGVTASTSDVNVPANTVDNNLATRWSGNGDGAWIQYDLGTTRTVTHVNVAVYNGNSRQNTFDIQVSLGGGLWTTVWSGTNTGTTTAEQTYEFDDVPARWVRYLGHGSTATTFNSVTEVSIFATPYAVVSRQLSVVSHWGQVCRMGFVVPISQRTNLAPP